MKLTSEFVPIISKKDFDTVATEFLTKYYPEALNRPMALPIQDIAIEKMDLCIEKVSITEDLEIFGQIFFNDGYAEVYISDTDEYIRKFVKKGTIFIDSNVYFMRNIGCERNTIAHECIHWFIHKPYHNLQILTGGDKAVACRCLTKDKDDKFTENWSNEDWMEWQANNIAPRILMPKNIFTEESKYKDIDELAILFQVSKQSVVIRLDELGLSIK